MNTLLQKSIGGFFELELASTDSSYHPDAVALTSGRACLNLLLSITQASKIYLPYYICDTVLEPLKHHSIPYEFYNIDKDLKPTKILSLKKGEYILYVNYFGLMNNIIDTLHEQYGQQLILDNTQDFFAKKYHDCWSFNSARKFFGVPDGAYLYIPSHFDKKKCLDFVKQRNTEIQHAHLIERLLNKPAHDLFIANEAQISLDIMSMSALSEKLLAAINYEDIIKRRKNNFLIYQNAFAKINQLSVTLNNNIPFCYPLWIHQEIQRELLYQQQIFIPTLWRDTITRNIPGFTFEKQFSLQLLPLPLDHRYNHEDCQRVIDAILTQYHNTK